MTTTITETLAHWLCTQRWQDLPSNVQQKAVDVVFDSVGEMVACSNWPEVEAIVKFIRRMGGMSHGNESDPVPTALTVGQ